MPRSTCEHIQYSSSTVCAFFFWRNIVLINGEDVGKIWIDSSSWNDISLSLVNLLQDIKVFFYLLVGQLCCYFYFRRGKILWIWFGTAAAPVVPKTSQLAKSNVNKLATLEDVMLLLMLIRYPCWMFGFVVKEWDMLPFWPKARKTQHPIPSRMWQVILFIFLFSTDPTKKTRMTSTNQSICQCFPFPLKCVQHSAQSLLVREHLTTIQIH